MSPSDLSMIQRRIEDTIHLLRALPADEVLRKSLNAQILELQEVERMLGIDPGAFYVREDV